MMKDINKNDTPETPVYQCDNCGKLSYIDGICRHCCKGMMREKEPSLRPKFAWM